MDDKGIVIEWNKEMEKITGIAHEEAEGKDEWELLKRCLSKDDYTPEELETIHNRRMQYLKNGGKQETVTREFVFGKPEGNKAYLQLYLFPIELTETCLFGSVVHDITEQKFNDIELEQYRTNLEEMVEYQTKELTVSQENLMSLNQRQSTFIKMMQILQLEENVPAAMSRVLDVIGNYTGVNRVQIWENNLDGITYGCSYEWCGEGIEPVIHFCQNLPIEYGKPWFEMLEADKIICTSDIYTLVKPIYEMLELQRVQSIVVLPLSKYGSHFGFISYTVCEVRVWDDKDIELLTNIAQVFSNFILRRQVENAMLM
jgi:PAS domain S-box-containing protein